jgi:hypothetical protein
MIAALRQLSASQARQLIKLLEPASDLEDVGDDELHTELFAALRRVLDASDGEDIPTLLRRRLVEVAGRHFELADDFDSSTDMEVAYLLVDFVLEAANRIGADDERREEFETFLRTKERGDRLRWLMSSQRFAAALRDETFDRKAAQQRADEVLAQPSAHRGTAEAILHDVAIISAVGTPIAALESKHSPSGLAARLGGGTLAAGGAGIAVGAAVLPLSAIAGGLYMAGRRRRELVEEQAANERAAVKARALRARRSKLVQATVLLSAYLVANAPHDLT